MKLAARALHPFAFSLILGSISACSPPAQPSSPSPTIRPVLTTPVASTPAVVDDTCGDLACTRHASLSEAWKHLIAPRPAVIGIGELHAKKGMLSASALSRFSELVPELAPSTSHLIVETWLPLKGCSSTVPVEKQAIGEATAQRPDSTPSDLERLLRKAHGVGITPQILRPTCADYTATFGSNGEVDFIALLSLVGRLLGDQAELAWVNRSGNKSILVYGGAVHNDAEPVERRAGYSYGARLRDLTGDRYVEVDLIVPELARLSRDLLRDEPWIELVDTKFLGSNDVWLLKLRANRYVIVFPDVSLAP